MTLTCVPWVVLTVLHSDARHTISDDHSDYHNDDATMTTSHESKIMTTTMTTNHENRGVSSQTNTHINMNMRKTPTAAATTILTATTMTTATTNGSNAHNINNSTVTMIEDARVQRNTPRRHTMPAGTVTRSHLAQQDKDSQRTRCCLFLKWLF
jgi:hypothetical protein